MKRCLYVLTLVLTLVTSVALPPGTAAQTSDTADAPRPAPVCVEPYNDPTIACVLSGVVDADGYLLVPGSSNFYRFDTAAPGGHVHVDLTNVPSDYDLYVLNAYGKVIGESVQDGTVDEQVDTDLDVAGAYFVQVTVDPSRLAIPDAAYRLHFVLVTPAPQAPVAFVGSPPAIPPAAPASVPTLAPTVQLSPTPLPTAPVSISVTPTDLSWPRALTVSWANIPDANKAAWFELFRPDDDTNQSTVPYGYESFRYVSCESNTPVAARPSGSCTFTLEPYDFTSGTSSKIMNYEFRLYGGRDDKTPLARSGLVRTRSFANATDSGASIQVSPSGLSSKGSVTVTWSNIPDANKSAWFQLFQPDDEINQSTVPYAGQSFRYVSCESNTPVAARPSGSCTFTLDPRDFIGAGKRATYEWRLFSDSRTNTLLARSSAFSLSTPSN